MSRLVGRVGMSHSFGIQKRVVTLLRFLTSLDFREERSVGYLMGSARYRCYRISVKYLILKLYLSRLVEQEGCALTLPPFSLLLRVVSSGSPFVRGRSFSYRGVPPFGRGWPLSLELWSSVIIELRRAVPLFQGRLCLELSGPSLSREIISVSRRSAPLFQVRLCLEKSDYPGSVHPDVHLHVDTNYLKSYIYF